ncbi:MAG: helix-turn-helix domain-containing protein [Bacteroidales bacterium]|jgi:AraC-like DNA-binding protein|nr:helix-turn-helix domain-containing protein [Bacteroidales bacterium]MCI1785968.1 helix-turn-helix domain-containing protein [Bacteroidales bacterium]
MNTEDNNQLSHINLGMIPPIDRTLVFDENLVIADNLSRKMSPEVDQAISEGKMTKMFQSENFTFPSRLDFYSILFCTCGKVFCRLNLTDYEISKNNILIAPAGIILDKLEYPQGTRFALIAFSNESFIADISSRSAKILRSGIYKPVLLTPGEKTMSILIGAYSILRQLVQRSEFYFRKDLLTGFVQIVSAALAQLVMDKHEEAYYNRKGTRYERIFRKFLQDVEANCVKERQLDFYAEKAFMSTKYFSKVITDVSGRHPSEWIRDNVILEAKVMLKSGTYNVQQVSDMLNFPNSSFFGKYFKMAVGISPRQYALKGIKE